MPTTEDRFTITSPEFLADPAAQLAAMRAAGPLVPVKVPLIGQVLLTTTDAGARALLKDRRFVRNPKPVTGKSLQQTFWFMPRFLSVLTEGLIMKDGDDHRRLRHLVELAFGRMTIEDMAGDMAGIADNLLHSIRRCKEGPQAWIGTE